MIRNFQINHAPWYVTLRKVIDNTLYQLCGWCRHLEYDFLIVFLDNITSEFNLEIRTV